jgi:hypothetical protein
MVFYLILPNIFYVSKYFYEDYWFGFEQEYFLYDMSTNMPLGFSPKMTPPPQGVLLFIIYLFIYFKPYYCGFFLFFFIFFINLFMF